VRRVEKQEKSNPHGIQAISCDDNVSKMTLTSIDLHHRLRVIPGDDEVKGERRRVKEEDHLTDILWSQSSSIEPPVEHSGEANQNTTEQEVYCLTR
jgi:hypothetical protein